MATDCLLALLVRGKEIREKLAEDEGVPAAVEAGAPMTWIERMDLRNTARAERYVETGSLVFPGAVEKRQLSEVDRTDLVELNKVRLWVPSCVCVSASPLLTCCGSTPPPPSRLCRMRS